jgi:hypothetical protein
MPAEPARVAHMRRVLFIAGNAAAGVALVLLALDPARRHGCGGRHFPTCDSAHAFVLDCALVLWYLCGG